MSDDLVGILAFAGVGLLATAMASQIFSYFIALNATPFLRAAWTAGLGYWVATAFVMFMLRYGYEPGDPFWAGPSAAPLYCLPSGLLALLFWYGEFRRAWVSDADPVPRGTRLANSDWRVGLFTIVSTIAVAALAVLIRWFARSL